MSFTVQFFKDQDANHFVGSGFAIAPGWVLTCQHVLEGCGESIWLKPSHDLDAEEIKGGTYQIHMNNGKNDLDLVLVPCKSQLPAIAKLGIGLDPTFWMDDLKKLNCRVKGGLHRGQRTITQVTQQATTREGLPIEVQVMGGVVEGYSGSPVVININGEEIAIGVAYQGGLGVNHSRIFMMDPIVDFIRENKAKGVLISNVQVVCVLAEILLDEAEGLSDQGEWKLASEKQEKASTVALKYLCIETAQSAAIRAANSRFQMLDFWRDFTEGGKLDYAKASAGLFNLIEQAEKLNCDQIAICSLKMMLCQKNKDLDNTLSLCLKILESINDEDRLKNFEAITAFINAVNFGLNAASKLQADSVIQELISKSRSLDSLVSGENLFLLKANRMPFELRNETDLDKRLETITNFGVFCKSVKCATKSDHSRILQIVGRLANEMNLKDYPNESICLLKISYELSDSFYDPITRANISMQIAELSAGNKKEAEFKKWIATSLSLVESCKNTEAAKENWASLRCMCIASRGRGFSRLANDESDPDIMLDYLKASISSFNEVLDFARNNQYKLFGTIAVFMADIDWWRGLTYSKMGMQIDAAQAFKSCRKHEESYSSQRFLNEIVLPAWHNEIVYLVQGGKFEEARKSSKELKSSPFITQEALKHLINFEDHVKEDIQPIIDWFDSDISKAIMHDTKHSVDAMIAKIVNPLLEWWEEWHDPNGASFKIPLFDFWGRGAFARIVAAIRINPTRVIAVDASSIDDIRYAARLFCPIFDTVLIKWKGLLQGYVAIMCPVPDELGGEPNHFGGHGYGRCSNKGWKEGWGPAMGSGNLMPDSVISFLSTEAIDLFRAGRLIVVPAPLVGCTQKAVGWSDDLLLDNFLRGVISTCGNSPISNHMKNQPREINLQTLSIPFIDNISMSNLAKIIDEVKDFAKPFQDLLIPLIANGDLKNEKWHNISRIDSDIRVAFNYFSDKLTGVVSSPGHHVNEHRSSLVVSERTHHMPGSDTLTNILQSVSPLNDNFTPWVFFWRLQSNGGNFKWTAPLNNPNYIPKNKLLPDVAFSNRFRGWLVPGDMGCGMFASRVV